MSLVFVRLDLHASQILSKRPLYLRREFADKDSGFHPGILSSFSTLEQARNSIDYIRNCVMRSLENIAQAEEILKHAGARPDIDRKACAAKLEQWPATFEGFLRNYGHELDVNHQQGAHLLKVHRVMAAMNLDLRGLVVKWVETACGTYMLGFKAILSHASAVIKAAKQAFKFSLDPGLLPALFFVASKCSHASIRRKALSLSLIDSSRAKRRLGLCAYCAGPRTIYRDQRGSSWGTDGRL